MSNLNINPYKQSSIYLKSESVLSNFLVSRTDHVGQMGHEGLNFVHILVANLAVLPVQVVGDVPGVQQRVDLSPRCCRCEYLQGLHVLQSHVSKNGHFRGPGLVHSWSHE